MRTLILCGMLALTLTACGTTSREDLEKQALAPHTPPHLTTFLTSKIGLKGVLPISDLSNVTLNPSLDAVIREECGIWETDPGFKSAAGIAAIVTGALINQAYNAIRIAIDKKAVKYLKNVTATVPTGFYAARPRISDEVTAITSDQADMIRSVDCVIVRDYEDAGKKNIKFEAIIQVTSDRSGGYMQLRPLRLYYDAPYANEGARNTTDVVLAVSVDSYYFDDNVGASARLAEAVFAEKELNLKTGPAVVYYDKDGMFPDWGSQPRYPLPAFTVRPDGKIPVSVKATAHETADLAAVPPTYGDVVFRVSAVERGELPPGLRVTSAIFKATGEGLRDLAKEVVKERVN